jgi:hypothetical protein
VLSGNYGSGCCLCGSRNPIKSPRRLDLDMGIY